MVKSVQPRGHYLLVTMQCPQPLHCYAPTPVRVVGAAGPVHDEIAFTGECLPTRY